MMINIRAQETLVKNINDDQDDADDGEVEAVEDNGDEYPIERDILPVQ